MPKAIYIYTRYVCTQPNLFFDNSCIIIILLLHFPVCPGGDITLKAVKDATWDVRARWDILAINLDVDNGTRDVSIVSNILHERQVVYFQVNVYLKCVAMFTLYIHWGCFVHAMCPVANCILSFT